MYADPDPDRAAQNNADPYGSGSETLNETFTFQSVERSFFLYGSPFLSFKNKQNYLNIFKIVYFFGGLECVGNSMSPIL